MFLLRKLWVFSAHNQIGPLTRHKVDSWRKQKVALILSLVLHSLSSHVYRTNVWDEIRFANIFGQDASLRTRMVHIVNFMSLDSQCCLRFCVANIHALLIYETERQKSRSQNTHLYNFIIFTPTFVKPSLFQL